MVVNTVLPEEYGGQGCSVLYIDTERTFRPERFKEMITGSKHIHGYEFDEDELADQLLDNIHVAQAFNSSHQMLLIEKLGTICEELKTAGKPVRLIVVDSLAAHFRSEFIGRGKLNERQQKLNKMMHDLSECAMLYNAVALVTNQVQDNPGQLFGDPIKPIGGNVVGHTSAFRIYIRKSKGDKRVLKLVDSPNLPDSEAIAAITMDGVVDD
jgi:DNA repair protein RadA